MTTRSIHITTDIDLDLADWLDQQSEREGRSLAETVRALLSKLYAEEREDRFWANRGAERLADFDLGKSLSHDEAIGE